jgi:hypothetical protein
MPTYTTLPEGADLVQDRTVAFTIIPVSDDVDLGYWWNKAGGVSAGKVKVTLVKPDGTTVLKENADVLLVNTAPQKIKVFINGLTATDIDFVGNLKFYPEFLIDDSWVQADVVVQAVADDAISG